MDFIVDPTIESTKRFIFSDTYSITAIDDILISSKLQV